MKVKTLHALLQGLLTISMSMIYIDDNEDAAGIMMMGMMIMMAMKTKMMMMMMTMKTKMMMMMMMT